MRTLHKIGLLLAALVLVPVLAYLGDQLASLDENEEMIAGIYDQQLETILYSVNQRAWDVATSWAGALGRVAAWDEPGDQTAPAARFLEANTPVQAIFAADTTGRVQHVVQRPDTAIAGVLLEPLIRAVLQGRRSTLRQVFAQKQTGYQKLEPLVLAQADGTRRVALVFVPDRPAAGAPLLGMVIDTEAFINTVLVPKLEEVSRGQFLLGVFQDASSEPLYATGSMTLSEARQARAVWLFPDYVVGIRLSGTSVEDVMQGRFRQNLLLLLAVSLVLVAGAWVVYRSIRKEVELARMKSDFVSNVSHELRTPLALIRMFVETLEMGRVRSEEQRQEYYRILSQEADRLTRLVNNILNFSRLEAGRKEYRFTSVDLNRIVDDVVALYTHTLDAQGFKTSVVLDPALPAVYGDGEAVSEAVINLIDNAIKYSGAVRYLGVQTGVEGPWVYVEVVDRGVGMAPENQRKVFDKFYRVTDGLVHTTKGTGLGLTLVKHIVEAHGGSVTVESRLGEGSRFRLRLKRAQQVPVAAAASSRQPAL